MEDLESVTRRLLTMMKVFILLVTVFIHLKLNTVTDSKFISHHYKQYNVTASDCSEVLPIKGKISEVECAVQCSLTSSCYTYHFLSGTCHHCSNIGRTSLDFSNTPGHMYSYVRKALYQDLPFNQSDLTTHWKVDVKEEERMRQGGMVWFSITPLQNISFKLIFMGADRKKFVFHMRHNVATDRILLGSRSSSGSWFPANRTLATMSPFPFVQDKRVDVQILATDVQFKIYIDWKFCCELSYQVDYMPTDIESVAVHGSVQVHELSF